MVVKVARTDRSICLESATTECLLLALDLWLGAIEHLEEVGCFGPHSGVQIGLGALDVVVEIVAERVDQVDCVVAGLLVCVSREEH